MEMEQLVSLHCTPPGPKVAIRELLLLEPQINLAYALPLPLTLEGLGCKPRKVSNTLSLFACWQDGYFITSRVCCPSLYSSIQRNNTL